MTQQSRTTETINRDNAAIRDIMHHVRELTVPDRATLAVGLVGHLATVMNRGQMTNLMSELQDEVTRVQDVPPARQRDDESRATTHTSDRSGEPRAASIAAADRSDARDSSNAMRGRAAHDGVGQAGRGEFSARELL